MTNERRYELADIAHRQHEKMKRARDEVFKKLTWKQFNKIHHDCRYDNLEKKVKEVSRNKNLIRLAAAADCHWETYQEASKQYKELTRKMHK
jgi:hypothetical protein